MTRIRLFSVISGLGLLLSSAQASTDYYTAGFYTRGADTAYHLDSGDPVYDPFYVPIDRIALVPRATVVAAHEDNLFLSPEKESGTTINFIPGIALIYGRPEGRHVFIDYGSVIRIYQSDDRLKDSPSHLLSLGGAYVTPKSQIHGRLGYRRLENVDTLAGARIIKEDYLVNLSLEHRISSKSSIALIGNYDWHEFTDDRYVDYTRTYGALRLYHDLTYKSQVFAQAGMGRDDLDSGESGYGDADFYDLSLGVRGKLSPKTSASGRMGYMWRTYDHDDINDVENWIAAIYGDYNPFGFTTFSAELFADIRPAINSAGSSSIDQRLTLSAARRLGTERLRGQASVFYGRTDYRGPSDRPEDADDSLIFDRREDDYWGFTLGMDWWSRNNVSCGLAYSYIRREGARGADEETQRAGSYESGRWTLRVSWNY